ncbi:MAG: metal-dependent transcriptional regulator [bacterium]|nr:metal-dependent transcriptional regulator [bacterium]
MVDPFYALVWALFLGASAAFLFWPESGFIPRWRLANRLTERVLIEDALKHLYDCEYHNQTPSVESLAGTLSISRKQAADVLVHVEARQLIKSEGGWLRLTSEGRDYALRILRIHRLWEQYLAEETGVAEADWHSQAELREHDLSVEEVDRLAEQMGYPVFDPHGDPIPTESGEIAPRRGRPITALKVGEPGIIVHLEDEPEATYAQIVAEGLHLGMRVEITEMTPERIRFWGDGEEHVLAPVLAANVSVVLAPAGKRPEEKFETLAFLKIGESGKVLRISPACRGLERRRLMDLGILPGTQIDAEMVSPSGDPTAYRVRGTSVALRKEQANHIHIQKATREEMEAI